MFSCKHMETPQFVHFVEHFLYFTKVYVKVGDLFLTSAQNRPIVPDHNSYIGCEYLIQVFHFL
jgi:hypothetical protein